MYKEEKIIFLTFPYIYLNEKNPSNTFGWGRYRGAEIYKMKKVIGFALFWVAVGMFIMLFVSPLFWQIVLILACLLLSYLLFCCK